MGRLGRPHVQAGVGGMIGRFIASGPGAPCHRCGKNIKAGADVYYDGPRLDDAVRTCADCIDWDLFGDAS